MKSLLTSNRDLSVISRFSNAMASIVISRFSNATTSDSYNYQGGVDIKYLDAGPKSCTYQYYFSDGDSHPFSTQVLTEFVWKGAPKNCIFMPRRAA